MVRLWSNAMTIDQAKLYAQREANSAGIWLTLWNLNQFNPLYVVRNYREGDENKHGYVMRFYPESIVR
jgi:hypothetical protein